MEGGSTATKKPLKPPMNAQLTPNDRTDRYFWRVHRRLSAVNHLFPARSQASTSLALRSGGNTG
jgi:hypothetical protein